MLELTPRKFVVYRNFLRDQHGDVVLLFREPRDGPDGKVMMSSPIVSIRRLSFAVIDRDPEPRGDLARYEIKTQNSLYEVQMPVKLAKLLAMQLAVISADVSEDLV